ncbi:cyclin-dependent kinase inhibitor 4 [Brassica rapa]|uniref:cyclin-dependent kinase inhibitor 4 n=1 Tax=Brassica campestris TaxID=3711 RepID=UPI0004F1ACB7|nr:cyclin-dependent kinase inhibitor 4 [Brassica rapa]
MKSVVKMGKYIKKSKLDGEAISLMDVSPGVLTRAKSLALQRRLQKPSPSSSSPSKQKTPTDCGGGGGGGSYLQLRSRRLQKKPPIVVIRRRKKQRRVRNPNSQNQDSGRGSGGGDGSRSDSVAESVVCGKGKDFNGEINMDELQGSERTTRESTPCSLMRKPESITSPGSSPKLNTGVSDDSNDQREESLSGSRCHLPTTPEMDEFFSCAEEEQQKQFIDKYNFDPVNEQPLPGRFEWKKIDD